MHSSDTKQLTKTSKLMVKVSELTEENIDESINLALKYYQSDNLELRIKCLCTFYFSLCMNRKYSELFTNNCFMEYFRSQLENGDTHLSCVNFIIKILTLLFLNNKDLFINEFKEPNSIWNEIVKLIIQQLPLTEAVIFLEKIIGYNDNFGKEFISNYDLINIYMKLLVIFQNSQHFQARIIQTMYTYPTLFELDEEKCICYLDLLNASLHTKGSYDYEAQPHFWRFLINYPQQYMFDLFLKSQAFYFVWRNFSMPGFSSARSLVLKYFYSIISSSKERGQLFLQLNIHEFLENVLLNHDNLKNECIELIELLLSMFPETLQNLLNRDMIELIHEAMSNSNFRFKTAVCSLLFGTLTCCEVPHIMDFLESNKETLFLTIDIALEEVQNAPRTKAVLGLMCRVVSRLPRDLSGAHPFHLSLARFAASEGFQDSLVEIANTSRDAELLSYAECLLAIEAPDA